MSAFELTVGADVLYEGRRHRVEAVTFDGFVAPYAALRCLDHVCCDGARRPVTWWSLDWPDRPENRPTVMLVRRGALPQETQP